MTALKDRPYFSLSVYSLHCPRSDTPFFKHKVRKSWGPEIIEVFARCLQSEPASQRHGGNVTSEYGRQDSDSFERMVAVHKNLFFPKETVWLSLIFKCLEWWDFFFSSIK